MENNHLYHKKIEKDPCIDMIDHTEQSLQREFLVTNGWFRLLESMGYC